MDDTLKFALTVLAGILGWLAVHWFSMSRDRRNKIRDLKTKYLIEAFQKLERYIHSNNPNQNELESAFADIQLFGQPEEVEAALKFMDTFSRQRHGDLGELLQLLRINLRKELRLPSANSKLLHLRIS